MQPLLVLNRYLNLNQPHCHFLLFTICIPLGECLSSPPPPQPSDDGEALMAIRAILFAHELGLSSFILEGERFYGCHQHS